MTCGFGAGAPGRPYHRVSPRTWAFSLVSLRIVPGLCPGYLVRHPERLAFDPKLGAAGSMITA